MNQQFLQMTVKRTILALMLTAASMAVPTYLNGQGIAEDRYAVVSNSTSDTGTALPSKYQRPRVTEAVPVSPIKTAPSGSAYDWSGFYVGGHAGYGWGNADTNVDPLPSAGQFVNLLPTTLKPDPRGFLGGIQGGYNCQKNHLVVGVEADISWTDIKGTKTVTPIVQNNGAPFPGAGFLTAGEKTSYFGTVRPRLGVAFGKLLVYGTFGVAYGRVRYTADSDFRPVGTEHYLADFSKTKIGTGGGFGAEVGLTKHISWKAELLFIDLQKENLTVNPAIPLPPFQVRYRWEAQASTFNSGINFRF